MTRLTAPPDTTAGDGAGLDAWASFRLTLESASRAMAEHYGRYQKLWAQLHQVQLTSPALAAPSAVYDYPDLLGPHTGYAWDIRRLALAGTWTGTVTVCKNNYSPTSLAATITAAGTPERYGKAQLLLLPHERLVLATSPDFTGTAILAGDALQIAGDCLPVYLT